ncbi:MULTISPECIES: cytochrome P450 family protein [Saccharothrix]|uniref:cytochrome P450 family protein n=1 Tax=Saccharothrix TaxID=2071 RepID=UPI000AEDBBC2|nr:cytochrome P450 [Saccharothrix sp. CB00851]
MEPIVLDPTGRDVHAEAALLLEQGPIAQVELPGRVRAWSVVGYDMVKEVLADERFAKDARKHWPAFINGEIGDDFPLIGWVLMDNMTTNDGAAHDRLRRLTANAFTLRRSEAMRPQVERITRELLDDLEKAEPDEVVDLKGRFAYPLPTRVICELFGVPEDRRRAVMRGGEINVDTTITHEEAVANVEEWHQAMFDLVEFKKHNLADDLLSRLIEQQQQDGSRLSDSEVAGTLHLMLGAGSETTTNLISRAVVALLRHPDQLEMAVSGEVPWSEVVEEALRVESPIAQLPFRFTTEEVRIGGVTIPKGDPVLIGFAASGRDVSKHGADADRFDITRKDKKHLSFGWGAHHCLGAPLARIEALVALPSLFERFPNISTAVPADEVKPAPTFLLNGVDTLPVRLNHR